ncbi:MAG TPA: sulfatase-like hydrolase/transferase [Gemmataceae bacterium]|jgi:arylsulfatase A|nr:sulfatase-like hydrolase/transferase [Gemmataceae bacterium]
MRHIIASLLLVPAFTLADAPKPNLIVLLADDMGYGDLGCFGNTRIKTPNLDRMAGDGIKLTSCYCGQSVCSPSRAALMTGRNPNRFGIKDWIPNGSGIFLPKTETTVAVHLKTAGYRTCLAGKWHLNGKFNGEEPTPGDHGFDHWLATQNNAAPSHQDPTNFVRNGKRAGPLKGNSSTILMDEALGFIQQNKEKPFCVFVTFHAPHEPVAVPGAWSEQYKDEPDETKRIYFGSVSLIDHEVGRLLKFLNDEKLAANTLVFFSSDNGPETLKRYKGAERSHGSPGSLRGMKLHMTEGGNRVPGIVRWPGHIKPGQTIDEPIGFVDVLPTFCALAGAKLPDKALDGVDVSPLLFANRPPERKRPLYWQYDKALGDTTPIWAVAIRRGDYKLLADAALEKFALYDLKADIGEKHDLTRDPKQAERLKAMTAELKGMWAEVNGKR